MASLPKLSRTEVEAAQAALLKVAKVLMDKGEIRRTTERREEG